MKEAIQQILIDIFTGKDNSTTDMGRVLWGLGVMVFIAITIVSFIQDKNFDYISWGTGFAAVLGAGAMAVKIKETTEPSKKTEEQAHAAELAEYLSSRKKRKAKAKVIKNSEEDDVI